MLCVLILYRNGETYSLKSSSTGTCFEKLFIAILFTLRVFAGIFCFYHATSIYMQSLKYSSYSYITTRMMLLLWTLHNSQNKYETAMNTKIPTRRLYVCSACCFLFLAYESLFFYVQMQ